MTDATAGKVRCANDLLASGFVQTPIGVLRDHDLTAGAKLVYGALLWYLWRGGNYPGQKTLAGDFGLSERSVRNHLTELANRGYIAVERGGLGKPNTYEILTPWLSDPRRQNLPVRPAKSASQTGKIGRSIQEQDSKANTEQQQEPPATGKSRHDRGLPAARRTAVVVASSAQTEADGTAPDLAERLAALGVAKSTAAKLLQEQDREIVARWVAFTEHRLRGGWVPKETPAAWLVSAIRSGDWIIPEWFRTPEEEAAAEVADREAAEERARQLAEAQERDREEAAAQRRAFEERLGIDEETRRVWQAARDLLQDRGQGTLALASAYLLPLADDEAAIATPVYFFCDRLAEREEAIRAALEEVTGRRIREVKITFVPADQKA